MQPTGGENITNKVLKRTQGIYLPQDLRHQVPRTAAPKKGITLPALKMRRETEAAKLRENCPAIARKARQSLRAEPHALRFRLNSTYINVNPPTPYPMPRYIQKQEWCNRPRKDLLLQVMWIDTR